MIDDVYPEYVFFLISASKWFLWEILWFDIICNKWTAVLFSMTYCGNFQWRWVTTFSRYTNYRPPASETLSPSTLSSNHSLTGVNTEFLLSSAAVDNASLLAPRTRPMQATSSTSPSPLIASGSVPCTKWNGSDAVLAKSGIAYANMLVKTEGGGPSGRLHQNGSGKPPGILDSPTLARVERAMLRHEEGAHMDGAHLQRAAYTQVGYLIKLNFIYWMKWNFWKIFFIVFSNLFFLKL